VSASSAPVVGVVGGGQLARMLHQGAIGLGVRVVVLDPDPQCAAALAGAERFDGAWTSRDDLIAFASSGVDVVTFDHELSAPDDLQALEAVSPVPIRPAPATKLLGQDKLHQRRTLSAAGLPVPAHAPVSAAAEVEAFAATHGWPVVLKAIRGGYDGRGVWIVRDAAQAAEVLAFAPNLLVEELVDIDREIAVMVARRPSGQVRAWPAMRTTQVDGICTEVILTAPSPIEDAAAELTRGLAERIGLTGVMAVELFVTGDGKLVLNELACRPHNSGHVTMDSCVTDQFEQHLRAVLDLPLGDPAPIVDAAVMVNVLGGPHPWGAAGLGAALEVEDATVHLYGKEHRPNRKLGHVNAIGASVDEARERALRAAAALGSPRPDR
jgi:5-(carboxyamino)imidazole ribonucleotide synthase